MYDNTSPQETPVPSRAAQMAVGEQSASPWYYIKCSPRDGRDPMGSLGQVLLWIFHFYPVRIIPPLLHTHSLIKHLQ